MNNLTNKSMKQLRAMAMKGMLGAAAVAAISAPLAISTTASAAAPASEATATQNLNRLLSNVRSMTANFSQETVAGRKTTKFSGNMSVQRQNQFRWETKSPSDQLIVANGNTLWVYDKDLKQVTRQSTANQVGDTPALLLSGDPAQISRNFKVSQPNATRNYYVLTPKSSNANFRNLSISFNQGRPVMMVLNDAIGQTTSIRFSNISLNKRIAASQFSFTPPAGVDVINQ